MSIDQSYHHLPEQVTELRREGYRIIKHEISMDSRLRDPSLWATSMNYAMTFEQTSIDQGQIQGAEQIKRNIIAIRLKSVTFHNIYNVFVNSSYNGEDEPYLALHMHDQVGRVFGPTVSRPFATFRARSSEDTNRTFLNGEVICGGELMFTTDQPYARKRLGLRIAHMNNNTIDTSAYDGLAISTSQSNWTAATNTMFQTSSVHNLTVGDKVLIVVVDTTALRLDIKDRTFEVISVPSTVRFVVAYDSTAYGATPTTNAYMIRQALQNVFTFDVYEMIRQ